MADLYTQGAQFQFADSQVGIAALATGIKVNVPILTDIQYHRKVQVKLWWKTHGMIGEDTFSEGSTEETKPGLPVIRKTDFQGKKGDTLRMHQRTNLPIGPSTGKVGNNQIVNSEVGWDLNYIKVKIEQWRQAVLTVGGMNEQRSPFNESFAQTETDLLSDWTSQVEDSGLTGALHYGFAYHLFRQYGTSNTGMVPIANPNTIFGNDRNFDASRTIQSLDPSGADNFSARSLEIGELFMKQGFFDPVRINGDDYWVVLISNAAKLTLMRDKDFRQAMVFARERGVDNPLFRNNNPIVYSNCIIFDYEKIRSVVGANNPDGLIVTNPGATNSAIIEAAYPWIGADGSILPSQIHQAYFLGANALCLAEGRMRMGDRQENDYQQFIGRDADNIWGANRSDWYNALGVLDNNQSSIRMINTLFNVDIVPLVVA